MSSAVPSSGANHTGKYEEIVSSLGLQISLYFHWRYSIVYMVFYMIKSWWIASGESDGFISVALPIVISLWSVIEIARIYLGYAGNLREQVPHLFGFLFLTIFPQSVLLIVFMVLQWNQSDTLVIDKVFNVFQLLFNIFQLIFGFIAIRSVIQAQTLKFKIKTNQRAQQRKASLLGNNQDELLIDQNDIKQD